MSLGWTSGSATLLSPHREQGLRFVLARQAAEALAADVESAWVSKSIEAFLFLVAGTVVLLAFAIVLGVHVALRNENTRVAIINTLATVFFLSVGTMVCIYLILINGRFEYQWTSFILFIAAGIGGLWWVLSGDRPSTALTVASWCCPLAMFYTVTNILVAKPGSEESTDPLVPFLVAGGAFGFTLAAMLVPLLSEFDVALGRTTGAGRVNSVWQMLEGKKHDSIRPFFRFTCCP